MSIKAIIPAAHSSAQKILFVTNNLSQAELAVLAAMNSKFEFLIYINNVHKEYSFQTDYILPANVKMTSDYKSVIMLTSIFSAAITTVGHISPVLNEKFTAIIKACIACNLPIIEVPHGLYQWGFNFSDDSQFVNTASNTHGGGYPVPTFANFQISWFDGDSVGYPRYRDERIRKVNDVEVPTYTVITTNTNWYMYGFDDQRVLAQAIFEYARSKPTELFVWCHHSAELGQMNLLNNMLGAKPPNIFRYGYDKDIYFHSMDTTEDVIEHAAAGITTISTCLLDFELHSIPTAVFWSEGLSAVSESMTHSASFRSPEELLKLEFTPPITGRLKPFNSGNFDRQISNAINQQTPINRSQQIFLYS